MNKIETETWMRGTDRQLSEGIGGWRIGWKKKMKGLAKRYIWHRHRQQCGDSQRKGGGGRWMWAKGGKWR